LAAARAGRTPARSSEQLGHVLDLAHAPVGEPEQHQAEGQDAAAAQRVDQRLLRLRVGRAHAGARELDHVEVERAGLVLDLELRDAVAEAAHARRAASALELQVGDARPGSVHLGELAL
jgi:hypothetical protein